MNKEDYNKYYIQGSDHYLIPKYEFIELFSEMENWKEESKGLNQKYLNAVADYETTMSELQELKKENKILRENAEHNDKVVDKVNWENQSLKKQLEEYKYSHSCSFVNICKNVKIANYNQQKEFIEYITSYIELLNNKPDLLEESQKDVLEEILSKYKSIIGVSDENK